MKIKKILAGLIVVVFLFVLSILITILLSPFWSWFEATTGIESLGHSGPADWCYLFIFLTSLLISILIFMKIRLKQKNTD